MNQLGVPVHLNGSTGAATVLQWTWIGGGRSLYFRFKNTGAGPLTLFLSAKARDANEGITVTAGEVVTIERGGFDEFWTTAAADQPFQAFISAQR